MSEGPRRFQVARSGIRADRLVADESGAGRRTVKAWFEKGLVRVNGHVVRASDLPPSGSEVTVASAGAGPGASPIEAQPPIVVAEDDRRIVVSKPAGLHCEQGRSAGSVAAFLEQRYGDRSGVGERAAEGGLVHRLDRDTSGVLLAARDAREYVRLRRAFREGRTLKEYLAIVDGRIEAPLRIETPLARRSGRMTAANAHDRPLDAETFVEPLEVARSWSLVRATIRSGAMHQIRAHLALEGHPLLGDELYGGRSLPGCARQGQLLHAFRLQVAGELDVTVGAPEDFLAELAGLRAGEGGRHRDLQALTSSS